MRCEHGFRLSTLYMNQPGEKDILPFYTEGKVLFGYAHILIHLEYVLGADSLLVPHYYCLSIILNLYQKGSCT